MYASMHSEGRPETQHSAEETFDGRSLEPHVEAIAKMVQSNNVGTLLDFGSGKGKLYTPIEGEEASRVKLMSAWPGVRVTCYDPGYEPYAGPVEGTFDAVISTDVVEHIPAPDIPWLLDELFGYATSCVFVVAACYPAKKKMPDGTNAHCTLYPPRWWEQRVREASARHPGIKWTLCTQSKSYFAFEDRKHWYKKGTRTEYVSGA